MTTRRDFLKGAGALTALLALPTSPWAAEQNVLTNAAPPPDLFSPAVLDLDFWVAPRSVHFVRPATGEKVKVKYWEDGTYLKDGVEELNHILRDISARQATQMDRALLDTLWAAQAFVKRYGFNDPMHILSGYRTEKSNQRLREQGIPAARQSLHVQAKAADIRMPGLNAQVLGDLLKGFQNGGVGFYLKSGSTTGGWIHADTGRIRQWQG